MVKVTRSKFKYTVMREKMVFSLNTNGRLDLSCMIDINEKIIVTQGQGQRSRFYARSRSSLYSTSNEMLLIYLLRVNVLVWVWIDLFGVSTPFRVKIVQEK